MLIVCHGLKRAYNLGKHELRPCSWLAVLSIDLRDAAGDTKSDQDKSTATNGVIHKYRLDKNGKRIGLEEFITPHPHGMFFRRKPQVGSLPKSAKNNSFEQQAQKQSHHLS